jgi:hypothetical protein
MPHLSGSSALIFNNPWENGHRISRSSLDIVMCYLFKTIYNICCSLPKRSSIEDWYVHMSNYWNLTYFNV